MHVTISVHVICRWSRQQFLTKLREAKRLLEKCARRLGLKVLTFDLLLFPLPIGTLPVGRRVDRTRSGVLINFSIATNIFILTFEDNLKHEFVKLPFFDDVPVLRQIKLILLKRIHWLDCIYRYADQRPFLIILWCLNRAGIDVILIIADAFVRHLQPSWNKVTLDSRLESHYFTLADDGLVISIDVIYVNNDFLSTLFFTSLCPIFIPIIGDLLVFQFLFLADFILLLIDFIQIDFPKWTGTFQLIFSLFLFLFGLPF